MAYTIQISEAQRAFLVKALSLIDMGAEELDTLFSEHVESGRPSEEISMLVSMLEELPEIEAETPGCLHGFCL